ncbi:DUF3540 domain-containing protein [Paracandidimonas soli]|uniref:Uncharacterized protein DUF3540 n=1 Tax=Paracandidimonas soli TaxID=1917182 RepID=A0A4V2VQ30_9BURK|nr:DUF3540 domain-containing protein [Paracandidimonas soli]TCU92999.1 uncharacterized protein DUF3540 [Paracandidimonas soli]
MGAALGARAILEYDPVQLIGEVTRVDSRGICTVRCDMRDWHVERAASCLLAPQNGDTVLISGPVPSQVYLIAVIRQAEPDASRLEVPGDLVIAAKDGGISLEAGQALRLQGRVNASLDTPLLEMRADEANCTVGKMEYLGVQARASIGSLQLVGRVCEVVMDRISQLAHSIFRLARDTEQVRAGHIDYQAEQSARMHGRQAVLTAKDLVKVDGDQIHMG